MSGSPSNRRVLITVGTDFHAFDRLIQWADRWSEANPDACVLVQHGSSRPPHIAKGIPFLSPAELQEEMAAASIVVTHGGPATITEARRVGRTPVCVPRDPSLGEHVDDHQQRFAGFLAERGLVRLVMTEDEFSDALSTVVDVGREDDAAQWMTPAGVEEVGRIVTRLINDHRKSDM
jgi:UDP-N-acetylglucosamine transferase subunit ALG13